MDETNISFTTDELSLLAQKVENNLATAKDYSNLDMFLNSLGLKNYLKDKFKELNIFDFESFINMRSDNKINNEDLRREARLVGVVLGAIEALKNTL